MIFLFCNHLLRELLVLAFLLQTVLLAVLLETFPGLLLAQLLRDDPQIYPLLPTVVSEEDLNRGTAIGMGLSVCRLQSRAVKTIRAMRRTSSTRVAAPILFPCVTTYSTAGGALRRGALDIGYSYGLRLGTTTSPGCQSVRHRGDRESSQRLRKVFHACLWRHSDKVTNKCPEVY